MSWNCPVKHRQPDDQLSKSNNLTSQNDAVSSPAIHHSIGHSPTLSIPRVPTLVKHFSSKFACKFVTRGSKRVVWENLHAGSNWRIKNTAPKWQSNPLVTHLPFPNTIQPYTAISVFLSFSWSSTSLYFLFYFHFSIFTSLRNFYKISRVFLYLGPVSDRWNFGKRMAGWKGSRGGEGGAQSVEHISSSRTVRLGKVQPQAPGHRTVFCNDRDANALAKFKVSVILIFTSFFLHCFCDFI